MLLENTSPRAQELAKHVSQAIHFGEWPVGSELPSMRELAREYSASLTTVQAALQAVEFQGLIERRSRRSSVVVARTPTVRLDGRAQIQQVAIVASCGTFGEDADPWTLASLVTFAADQALGQRNLQPTRLLYRTDVSDPVADLVSKIDVDRESLGGVIIINNPHILPLREELDKRGLPWVVVNRPDGTARHNYVAADNERICQLAGECLAHMQLHKVLVLMVSGASRSETEREKLTGIVRGFLEAGVPIRGIEYRLLDDHHTREAGRLGSDYIAGSEKLVREYIRSHGQPDAIVALTDEMVAGAVNACSEAGFDVPADVRVIGAKGADIARHMRPPLTVIAQPTRELGEQAVEMIVEMMQANSIRLPARRVPGQFIIRESCMVPQDLLNKLAARYPDIEQHMECP